MVEYLNFYKNKRVLVTGATGFKGSWLCQILKLFGSKIMGIGYKPNKNQNLFDELKLRDKIKLEYIDIRNYQKLKNKIEKFKPQIVFHLAAQPIIFESYRNPNATINDISDDMIDVLEI